MANRIVEDLFLKESIPDVGDLSAKIDDLSSEMSSLESTVVFNDACLSAAVDKKIFIDGISAESLCAIHISQDDFYQRVENGQISSNELYIVSSDYINAYGEQLKNLAQPTDLSDAATKEYVDVISSSLSSQIERKIDKHDGGDVSSNIVIFQHDMKILSGNYSQTDTPLNNKTYSSSNAFLQANIDSLYGDSYVGTKAFCVIGVSSEQNQIKLSGNINILKEAITQKEVGDFYTNVEKSRALTHVFSNYTQTTLNLDTQLSDAMFSLTLDDKSASIAYHIADVDVDSGIVTLVEPLSIYGFNQLDGKTTEWFIEKFKNDDNALYLVGFPEIGNVVPKNLFGQHAEGGSVRAIGRQTHVEGRDNVSDIRYTHAEGSHNIAGDMASHAEGFVTEAKARYSHSEGFGTRASGQASHAEGESTVASGKNSHAGGWGSRAAGDWSFAQGRYAEASSYSTVAAGAYVSAYATNTIAMGTYALADDRRAFVWNGLGNNQSSDYYSSNGDSTFNINPLSGSKGFYIGLSSLDDYLKQNVISASNYVKDHDLDEYAKTSDLDDYVEKSSISTDIKYINSLQTSIVAPFEEQNGWIKNGRTWGYAQSSTAINETFKFFVVPVSAGQEISITASKFNPAFITMLSGDRYLKAVNDQAVGIVSGWGTPHNDYKGEIPINQTSSFVVPNSATMLWCCTRFYGAEATPQKIMVDGSEVIHTYAQNSINIDKAVNSNLSSYGNIKLSKTINQFNKDDPTNIDRFFLSAGSTCFIYAKAPAVASQYFGTTHFIPCCKDNVLVCAAKSMASTGGRQVIRAIQYFDANFNLLSCMSGQSKEAVGFNAVSRSSFIEHAVWWQKVAVDGCRYVKLCYDWENKDKFVVQVENSNYIPNELTAYVPFIKNTSDTNPSAWSNKKILFAGDSITRPLINDYSSDQPIETDKGLAKKGYTEFVCDKLNCTQFKDSTTAWDGAMLALSSPNAQTSGRRSLVTSISSWPDDVDAVHVMIGTNDWNYSWPDLGSFNDLSDINQDNLSSFYGALGYACRTLLEKYPGKPIAFSTPIKRWKDGGFDELSNIAPSKGWIKNDGTWNNGAYQYKLIPIMHPNSQIEIKGSPHPSCDTWYTFLSCWPRTSGYVGVYAPTSPLSQYTPGQNRIPRGTIKTFTSPPVLSYLWVTYSRNDDTSIYGSDAGNAWPTYIKINDIDVTAAGYKIPFNLNRYDLPNSKGSTLGDFVKAIKDVCGYYGVKVIDLFNECPINPIIQSHLQNLIPDGTHPTPRGHELIARYVAGALDEIR